MSTLRFNTHRDLIVWQKAIALAVDIHRLCERMPRHELFGLTSQLRRAAVSVPANIAEGAARRTTKDFMSFLHVARGSLAELETHLLLAQRVGYLDEECNRQLQPAVDEVGRLINAIIVGLRRKRDAVPATR